jgi:hypothetical protein
MTRLHNGVALALLSLILGVCSCAYVPPSTNKSKWYATLETNHAVTQLYLNSNEWVPLIGPDGFGGHRRVGLYFAELDGIGPVFRDPVFGKVSAPELKSRCLGTITVDMTKKAITVDLLQNTAKAGDSSRVEPSAVNGTYPLRH